LSTSHYKKAFTTDSTCQNESVDEFTRIKEHNLSLQENLVRFRAMVENNPAGIVVEDKDRQIILTNQAFCNIFSLPAQPEDLTGSNCSEAAEAVKHLLAEPEEFPRRIDEIISRRKQIIGEVISFADGRIYERDYIPVFTEENATFIGHMWQYREITDKKKDERDLVYQNKLLEALFKNSTDAIIYFDQDHRIIDINDRFKELFGYRLSEIKGMDIDDLHDTGKKGSGNREYTRQMFEGKNVSSEGIRYSKYGNPINLIVKGIPVIIEGDFCGGYAIYTDITERKHYEEQLKYLSLHDQLTGLYNRVYFENELERLDESREYPITIISVDLDGLKLVNDTVGHARGDQLLITCAKILKQSLRRSDILARVGGDEFVAILPRATAVTGEEITARIQKQLELHNREKQGQLPLSVSLGYATAENPGKRLQETFKEADDLMYRAKLHKGVDARAQIINSLMATLGERDFITEGHARRLEHLCVKLGEKMNLPNKQLSDLRLLAQVHDLGKVGVPDHILFKKGNLTEDEWALMKQHSEKGYRIALSSVDLSGIADLILKHHECWNGSGYPLGLKEEEIPVECRILAVADAYDAMTNDRPYRKAMPPEKAVEELKANAGGQFDPTMVDLFIAVLDQEKTKTRG